MNIAMQKRRGAVHDVNLMWLLRSGMGEGRGEMSLVDATRGRRSVSALVINQCEKF